MTVDNSQFSEIQRTEAFRTEAMQQLIRQTKATEATQGYVGWLLAITVFLVLVNTVSVMALYG